MTVISCYTCNRNALKTTTTLTLTAPKTELSPELQQLLTRIGNNLHIGIALYGFSQAEKQLVNQLVDLDKAEYKQVRNSYTGHEEWHVVALSAYRRTITPSI